MTSDERCRSDLEKKSRFVLSFALYGGNGCHGDVLVSSAEDLGRDWERSHSHRWGPTGSMATFYVRVSSWKGEDGMDY